MNSMLWSCHALDFKWLFSHGAGICTGWIKITKMMKKSLFWEQLITSLSHPAPPMTFSLSLWHTYISTPFLLVFRLNKRSIYLDLSRSLLSQFILPTFTFPVFQTRSSMRFKLIHPHSLASQSCVKQVSKAGMLRGKKITRKMSSSLLKWGMLKHTCILTKLTHATQ